MPGEEEPKQRRRRPVAVPLIVALAVWLILILLYSFPDLVPPTKLSFELWQNVGNLVLAAMIFWAALSRFTFAPVGTSEGPEAPDKASGDEAPIEAEVVPEPTGADRAVADRPKPRAAPNAAAERVKAVAERAKGVTVAPAEAPVAADAPRPPSPDEVMRVVEWPPKKPGGVYSDTLVQVDYDLVLNMRTKLGRVCGNCEGLPECKRRVGGRLSDEMFEANFECKEGLKRELAKVRRAKQAEALAKASVPAPEGAQAVEAEPAEAEAVPVQLPQPDAEAKAAPGKAETPPEAKPPEAPPVPPGPVPAAPPAHKAEAAVAVPEERTAPATETAPVPESKATTAPPAPTPPEGPDEELDIEPDDAAAETEQANPPPAGVEAKPKLRKKLLRRKG